MKRAPMTKAYNVSRMLLQPLPSWSIAIIMYSTKEAEKCYTKIWLFTARKKHRGTYTSGRILVLSVVYQGLSSKEYILADFFKHKSKSSIHLTNKSDQKEKSLTAAEIMSIRIIGNCNLFYANLIRKTFPCLLLPQIFFLPSGKPSSYHSENTVNYFLRNH